MATTVTRRESATGWHEMAVRAPHASLNGAVLRYAGYIERTSAPVRRLETPFRGVVLILSFDETIRIVDAAGEDRAHRSFAGGLSDGPTYTEHGGEQHGIQIDLAPLAAGALFAVPMSELTNRVLELDQLLGREADRLLEQLHDVGSWERRFALLDAVLGRRLAASSPADVGVVEACRRLEHSHGLIEIGELCRWIGWSRRHLAVRFREQVGLTPKTYARILRFERATALLSRDGGARLPEVALECGYYDQAHLNRDFRQFAGTSPGDYIDRLLPGVAGVAGQVTSVQDSSRAAA